MDSAISIAGYGQTDACRMERHRHTHQASRVIACCRAQFCLYTAYSLFRS